MGTFLYYLVNFLVLFLALVPLGLILWASHGRTWNPIFKLIFGFTLVGLASFYFGWLSESLNYFSLSEVVTNSEKQLKTDILNAFGMWVFAVPALYLALGTNLITNFIKFKN